MKSSHSRLKQLDILRAVAIFLVLGRHPVIEPSAAGMLQIPALLWKRFGWTGVDLFFVLSGFLIGGLLFSELSRSGAVDVKRFLIRRSFKIWPAYYVLLAFVILATPVSASRLSTFAPHAFHLQNYFRDVPLHTWSLAIEEHFYLALPLLLYILASCTRRDPNRLFSAIIGMTLAVVATCLTLRLIGGVPVEDLARRLSPTHVRADSLFWGVFLAALYHLKPDWFATVARHRKSLLVLAVLLISPMLFLSIETSVFVTTWGYVFLYLGYGCLIVAAVSAPDRVAPSLPGRALVFVGASSYSIYLWHWHLSNLLKAAAARAYPSGMPPALWWLLLMALYIVAAIAAGWFMGRLVEVPMLKLRDRMFPSRASALKPVISRPGQRNPIPLQPSSPLRGLTVNQ